MTDGKIVEEGATAEIFDAPQHAYTQHLLSAEPKGDPPERRPDASMILQGTDVRVWFPIKKGVFRRTVAHIKAVDGVTLSVREGETVAGEVHDEHGRPVPGAFVSVYRKERPADPLGVGTHWFSTNADDKGRFRFSGFGVGDSLKLTARQRTDRAWSYSRGKAVKSGTTGVVLTIVE